MVYAYPSSGRYTFDTQTGGDEDNFTWTGQSTPQTELSNPNTAGEWCWDNNATSSSNVGPDHGQGGDPDGYVYTEMTSQVSGDLWYCEFETTIDTTSVSLNVDFYWCMRGDAVRATLDVQTREDSGGSWITQFTTGYGDETIPGTSGATTWFNKDYDITNNGADPPSHASTYVRFRITATADPTTSMWHNDCGLDGILIYGDDLVTGPTITDVDTDEDIHDQQTAVVITGDTFGTEGANSRVRLNSQSDGLGTNVVQTDTSWADTSIQFTVVKGSLSYGTVYVFVRNQSMEENTTGFTINLYDYLNVTGLSDTTFRSSDTGIVISGEGFGTSQGSSEVILSSQADGGGTTVDQTITSWASDTSITFTVVQGALSPGTVYCFVERNQSGQGDSASRLSNGTQCTLLPPLMFKMSTSTQFADKAPTTYQLSVPSSGTFKVGQILESSNPADANSLSAGQYSEYEFCIQAQTESEAGGTYEFRLVDGAQSGEKLEEYDVTAKVTIAP